MRRMIYTRVVIDMATGDVLEQDGFLYDGPVSECGGGSGSGGGSTTTNTVDKVYKARMAAISEEQNAWARDYFNMWQQYYKPYEIAQARANMDVLPAETDLYKKQLVSATELLPQQTEAAKQFLTASTQGVDVNERMALATADTANAWKGVQDQTSRANARMGVNPNSGRYQGIPGGLGHAAGRSACRSPHPGPCGRGTGKLRPPDQSRRIQCFRRHSARPRHHEKLGDALCHYTKRKILTTWRRRASRARHSPQRP